jgi:hypothetical protein
MTESDRALLVELRKYLLQLHKTLIDWQRADYERVHGRLQTTQLLNVMFNDPAFAWLRSMSGLIVRIDEALEVKPHSVADPPTRPEAATARPRRSSPDRERAEAGSGPLVAAARELIAPEAGSTYAQRYHAALQELPDAVLAHRDLVVLLKLQRPASNA